MFFGLLEQLFHGKLAGYRLLNFSADRQECLQLSRVTLPITRSSSLLLLCDDRSAFCRVWRVPPCLFGSAMFPPLSSAPPNSQSAGKLSFFQPLECQEKTRRFCTLERAWAGWGGVGSHDLVFCLLRLQMGKDHAPFLIPAQAAAVISYLSPPTMKSTDACTRPRTPLILGLRQPQVLRIAAFRCF